LRIAAAAVATAITVTLSGQVDTMRVGGKLSVAADAQPRLPASASAPDAQSTVSFDTFRFIGAWNIFDPTRVGHPGEGAAKPQIETISFVGTMEYEKGQLAFFDSTNRSYPQALHEGETIAQFTVKRITPDTVELTRDSTPLTLKVGQQLRRPPGGEWTMGATMGGPMGSVMGADKAPAETSAPEIPSDASAILKKLMEQRQKELKQ
jgi:hypothetical protein